MNKRVMDKLLFPRVATAAGLLAAASAGQAQTFSLEGAVIDSNSSRNLGVVTERGDLNALFRAQKAMTFGILRSAGISLDQLPPEVRARIERFQTTNVEAFRAFSQGLDLKDQGKFVEAKEFFRRAAELDPGFALAVEQRQSMPDVNLGLGVQTRAVVVVAAGQAVDRGKASFTVDAARAAAAIAAGATVVATVVPSTETALASTAGGYTTNPAGSSAQFSPNLAVALTYNISSGGLNFALASPSEWLAGDYRVSGGVLESVGNLSKGFLAARLGAASTDTGSRTLADGTIAYWGSWLSTPGANTSATVTVGGTALSAPALGPVNYVIGDATRVMPTTGTAVFSPVGGSLVNPSGNIAVDFVNRSVTLQNLGFSVNGMAFAGLSGSANYAANSGSGLFNGNYTSGSCTGCAAFSAGNSSFGGNFIGRNADGLALSTFLFTSPTTTVSGAHLYGR